jgi:shikimate dehydrogenase
MLKFGLIGYPLTHSFSPRIHKLIYELNTINASYFLIEISLKNFNKNLLNEIFDDFHGFNITIPYKTKIIKYLDELSEEAENIGAVNTIKKINNKWIGFNTDAEGFIFPIKNIYQNIDTCLLIGTGGAARAVIYAILTYVKPKILIILGRDVHKTDELKNKYKNTSKKIHIESDNISNINNYLNKVDLIVNSTSVGMHPNINNSILPESFIIKDNAIAYDIIYNPLETIFLKKVKEICPGCITINGIQMLIAQAVRSIEIWTGKVISTKNIINTLNKSEILL